MKFRSRRVNPLGRQYARMTRMLFVFSLAVVLALALKWMPGEQPRHEAHPSANPAAHTDAPADDGLQKVGALATR